MKKLQWVKTIALYLSWFPLAVIDFLVASTAYPLAPIAALFAKDGRLPKLFWYLETYDNPVEGDGGHVRRWQAFAEKYGAFGRYCQRTAWLWRNKAYNYSYYVSGRDISQPVKWHGIPGADGYVNKVIPGWLVLHTPEAWCIYTYLPWIRLFGRQFYLRIYLGWKFKGEAEKPGETRRGMMVVFVSPFRNRKIE